MRPFRYVPGSSFLHKLNPSVKLLAVALVTIAITFVLDVYTPLVFLILSLLVLCFFGQLPLSYVLRSLAPFALLALSFVALNSVFATDLPQETPLFRVGPFVLIKEALLLGISIGLRVLFLVSTSLLFVATTEPRDLVLSLTQQARLPYKLAFAVQVAYRFIPILAGEYANIRAAARVRGAGEGRGLLAGIKALRRDTLPLLAGAIRRSERLAVAMDSRAFGAFPERTYHRRLQAQSRDWLFLFGVIAISALTFALLFYSGLISGVGVQAG